MDSAKKENNGVSKNKENVPEYGKVVLTVKNCLLSKEKLLSTPSQIDGLDPETEMDLRVLGCELIQTAGILLRLPQVAMATAQVLFQRFYYSKSFVRQNYEITGMACLYLACKIEEELRKIRDVVNVYHHIKQVNQQKTLNPLILDHSYISLKCQVIKAERRVLKELGFCVHVKHPHKLIVLYLQVLGLENKHNLMQIAWNYMNDSLRTDVFVRYQPETVACACIYLTARKLKIPLPRAPLWFSVFLVEEADIQDICTRILSLYTRNKPDAEHLEKKVQELCKKFEETRLRNKTGFNNITSGTNTPNSPVPAEKKASPKRRSSDRSRSRSPSDSPRHKKYKRSRSRSYDKYKKSRSRRSRSNSPPSKNYKDKRYRSRSRSYERDHRADHKDSKYVSDRYKEDRYYGRDDRYRRDDDRYRRDDDRYRKEDDYKYKKDDDKYKRDDDAVHIKKDEISKVKKVDDVLRSRKDDENHRREEELVKHRKEEDRRKKEEDSHKHKKEKILIKESGDKKLKSKHTSSKHKSSAEKKKRKKHYDDGIEEDDEIEIIHVKKEKKSR